MGGGGDAKGVRGPAQIPSNEPRAGSRDIEVLWAALVDHSGRLDVRDLGAGCDEGVTRERACVRPRSSSDCIPASRAGSHDIEVLWAALVDHSGRLDVRDSWAGLGEAPMRTEVAP